MREIALNERAVRVAFVNGVMYVKHGLHSGAGDFPHNRNRFGQAGDDIRLTGRQGFDE